MGKSDEYRRFAERVLKVWRATEVWKTRPPSRRWRRFGFAWQSKARTAVRNMRPTSVMAS